MRYKISAPVEILSTYVTSILSTHKRFLQLEWRKALRHIAWSTDSVHICFDKLYNCLGNPTSLIYRLVTLRNISEIILIVRIKY